MPVVVTRDAKGALHAWENRCAHRGALVCMQARGKAERFACIYHNWVYDHEGNLATVAFRKGIAGKGGMPADASRSRRRRRSCGLQPSTAWYSAHCRKTSPDLEN